MNYLPPKYLVVKKQILEMLNNGELEPDTLLPSERELMEIHNVSRITVRKAIEELEQEGYLYKVQGKGTFVKSGYKRQDLISITSCTQDVRRQGMVPTRRVVYKKIAEADINNRKQLHLAEGEKVFRMARIYYADGMPINYTAVVLPYKIFEKIEEYDFSEYSLYEVMEKNYHVRITRAERILEAVNADEKVSEYLDVSMSVPLILFRCTTYGEVEGKEIPIETFKCYYRSDKFKFYIDQVRKN